MYRQDTCFSAANTPLFTQLFGEAAAPVPHRHRHDAPQHMHPRCEHAVARPSLGTPPLEVAAVTAEPCSREPSSPLLHEQQGVASSPPLDAAAEPSDLHVAERPAVPFRKVMRELDRRFREQMEVHRGLNESMQQLDVLCGEISLFQTEQRTARIASSLQRRALSSFEDAAAAAAASAPVASSTTAAAVRASGGPIALPHPLSSSLSSAKLRPEQSSTSTLLERVLESYTRESANASRRGSAPPLPAAEKKKTLPADVVRPPEEPQPYMRVIYVPVTKQQQEGAEDASGAASSDGRRGSPSSSTSSAAADVAVATESSYSDDFDASGSGGGVSTDASLLSAAASTSLATTTAAATTTTSSSSGSMTVETASDARSSASGVETVRTTLSSAWEEGSDARGRDGGGEDAPLLATLQEFHRACSGANRLLQALLHPDDNGGGGGVSRLSAKGLQEAAPPLNAAASSEHRAWLATLRRDVGDIHKLHRFVEHLKRNMKALDCQRKVQEARRRLFVKAQRLAKAHRQVRRDGSTLSQAMDDIADLIGSDASRDNNDTDVMDEVATAASLSWGDGSSSDGIADDVSAAAAGSDAMMDDAVLDELQDDGVGGGGSSSGGDILDEVAGDLSWAQAESDFAEALAGASDIDEILADGVPLPSDDAATAPITEEIAPVSSSAATTSVESVLDEQLSGTPDSVSVEDDAVAVSSAASDPDDADVSSVMPASSTTASDTAVRRHYGGSSSNHDETDSEESALDALECDMHEGKPRRVKALESVHPSAFSPLYAADETETTATDTQASEEKVHSSDSETSQECVLRATGQDVGVLESAAIAADVVLPPRSEQVAASAPPSDVATDRPSHSTALREYAADDLVAQLEWKERQLSLFRQLRPKSVWAEEGDEKDADATEPVEGKADYHWGMLETLLQCRFGGESAYNYDDEEDADERDDADDGSGWTDADEVSGVNGQSSIDVSADAEYSDAVA